MKTIENDGAFLGRSFLDFFFAMIFLDGAYLFFYFSHFGGWEDDLYLSTQQIDG